MDEEIPTISESEYNQLIGSVGSSVSEDIPTITESEFNKLSNPISEAPAILKAGSGFLKGVADLGQFGQNVLEGDLLGSRRKLAGAGVGDYLQSAFDWASGVKDVTKIGEGGGVHTAASYLPQAVLGPEKAGANAFQTLFTAGAAGLGREYGGDKGEALGVIGSLFGPSVLSKPLTKAGQALERKSVGASYIDYMRDADSMGRVDLPEGDLSTFTKQSLDELISSGKLGASRNPTNLKSIADKEQASLGRQIGEVLSKAEDGSSPVFPSFRRAQELLDSGAIPADEIPRYESRLKNLILNTVEQGKGKLGFLQQQKIAIGSKYDAADGVLNKFNRALYHDLQDAIETAAPEIAPLNQELSKWKVVDSMLKRGVARAENADLVSSLKGAMRTSGGFGVPIITGALTGGAPGALAGAVVGALGTSARGQSVLGKTLKSAGTASDGLAREAFSLYQSVFPNLFQKENDLGFDKTKPNTGREQLDSMLEGLQEGSGQQLKGKQERGKLEAVSSSPNSSPIRTVFQPASLKSSPMRSFLEMDKQPVDIVEQAIDADPYYSALYEAESSRNPSAKNKTSSAAGGFQLIKATAKALGVEDPLDLSQSFAGVKKLTEQHAERFGEDPVKLYAAHYMGAGLLQKVLDKKDLSDKEQEIVDSFFDSALPRFRRIYEKVAKKSTGVLEA